jgi:hypothetical protein
VVNVQTVSMETKPFSYNLKKIVVWILYFIGMVVTAWIAWLLWFYFTGGTMEWVWIIVYMLIGTASLTIAAKLREKEIENGDSQDKYEGD